MQKAETIITEIDFLETDRKIYNINKIKCNNIGYNVLIRRKGFKKSSSTPYHILKLTVRRTILKTTLISKLFYWFMGKDEYAGL